MPAREEAPGLAASVGGTGLDYVVLDLKGVLAKRYPVLEAWEVLKQ